MVGLRSCHAQASLRYANCLSGLPIPPLWTIIARTYTPVEIFLTAGVIYLLFTFVFTQAFSQLERRANRHLAPRS